MNAFDRIKREQAKMEASLDRINRGVEASLERINRGVTTSSNGVVHTAGTVFDPIEAAGLRGTKSFSLLGGGWTLVLEEAIDGMDVVWERFLDCAFLEPWKSPLEKRAQSIAVRAVMRCMFTAAKDAGLVVTLYRK